MPIVEISVVPIPVGADNPGLSSYIAKAVKVVEESGLDYRLAPMGTVVQGSLKDIFALVEKIHNEILGEETPRVVTTLKIDHRIDKESSIDRKVQAVESKLR